MNKKNQMIILSLDAAGSRDLEIMKTLPNFKKFINGAAGANQVVSVYPSLTYPAHSTIVTGRYPAHHGVVNNQKIQPKRKNPDWFWKRSGISGTTLYDEAGKIGMKTAALLWPVTGKARINYNLPEILPNRFWENQILVSLLNGTPWYEAELQYHFASVRNGIKQPMLDDFVHSCMLYTLKKYNPDLFLVHLTDLDTNRHLYGVDSPQSLAALKRHDARLGELIDCLKETGRYDTTNLVILGDHYQKNTEYEINPNREFLNRGYLNIKSGNIKEWRVLARGCDGSCYIYVKETSMIPEVYQVLEQMKANCPKGGIAEILCRDQVKELGADPDCAFMLEAGDGFCFQNGWDVWVQKSSYQANHGYLPDREGYHTFFMAAGPDFSGGKRIPKMNLVDIAPTLAKVIGVELGKTDGEVQEELLFKK